MSYDIYIIDPETKEVAELPENHHMKGGTYAIGGTSKAKLNITYNYATWFHEYIDADSGIKHLYGMTTEKAAEVLKTAIAEMKGKPDTDYWLPSEGNAKAALINLLALCQMVPGGILDGD